MYPSQLALSLSYFFRFTNKSMKFDCWSGSLWVFLKSSSDHAPSLFILLVCFFVLFCFLFVFWFPHVTEDSIRHWWSQIYNRSLSHENLNIFSDAWKLIKIWLNTLKWTSCVRRSKFNCFSAQFWCKNFWEWKSNYGYFMNGIITDRWKVDFEKKALKVGQFLEKYCVQ